MDPHMNRALQNAKSHTLSSTSTNQSISNLGGDLPSHPPPSYYMAVDPNAPIPNMHSPYEPEDEEKEEEEDELPEVTINASTQVRGHGNIISIPPMDAVRVAGLLHTMMFGPPNMSPTHHVPAHTSPTLNPTPLGQVPQVHSSNTHSTTHTISYRKLRFPKLNITVNCGATVVGDKNIVGPGIGDIARHMQLARGQQLQAQAAAMRQEAQARAQQAHLHAQHANMQSIPVPILTPMRSRRGSEGSEDSGVELKACGEGSGSCSKRKADSEVKVEDGGREAKRRSIDDLLN